MRSTRRIEASLTDEVWLTTGALAWTRLPQDVKKGLLTSLNNIALVRGGISQRGKVKRVPLVEVACELWSVENGIVHGCAIPVMFRSHPFWGVRLSAHVAISDESILRSVLIHEFCHCYWFLIRGLDAAERGSFLPEEVDFDQFNDSDDRSRMVDPGDWFSQPDAESMIYHDDERTRKTFDENFSALQPFLRTCKPDFKSAADRASSGPLVPPDFIEHLKRLRSEK